MPVNDECQVKYHGRHPYGLEHGGARVLGPLCAGGGQKAGAYIKIKVYVTQT